MAKRVVGIDIGNEAVRAAEVVDQGKGRVTLLRYHEVTLPEGVISRGEVTEINTVATAIKQLWAKGKFSSKEVVLGVGNQRVLVRDLSVPRAPLRAIRNHLPFHVQDLLPVPVSDALLDFYPTSEGEGEAGPMVNGLLVAAVKEAVLGNVKAVQGAGLHPIDVDLSPFAVSRLLLTRQRVGGTVAVIDAGATATTVVVAIDGVPQFVRIIPSGSNDLTAALVARLELTEAQADRAKKSLGLATQVQTMEEHQAVQVIYELANEMLGSLRNTVNYFSNVRPTTPVERIVVTGGGVLLPGLAKALADVTRLPVTFGDPLAGITVAKTVDARELELGRNVMAVAVGLAIGHAA